MSASKMVLPDSPAPGADGLRDALPDGPGPAPFTPARMVCVGRPPHVPFGTTAVRSRQRGLFRWWAFYDLPAPPEIPHRPPSINRGWSVQLLCSLNISPGSAAVGIWAKYLLRGLAALECVLEVSCHGGTTVKEPNRIQVFARPRPTENSPMLAGRTFQQACWRTAVTSSHVARLDRTSAGLREDRLGSCLSAPCLPSAPSEDSDAPSFTAKLGRIHCR